MCQVKIGTLSHMASFLQVISPARRAPYAGLLGTLARDGDGWRFRRAIAKSAAATQSPRLCPCAITRDFDTILNSRHAQPVRWGRWGRDTNYLEDSLGSSRLQHSATEPDR